MRKKAQDQKKPKSPSLELSESSSRNPALDTHYRWTQESQAFTILEGLMLNSTWMGASRQRKSGTQWI